MTNKDSKLSYREKAEQAGFRMVERDGVKFFVGEPAVVKPSEVRRSDDQKRNEKELPAKKTP